MGAVRTSPRRRPTAAFWSTAQIVALVAVFAAAAIVVVVRMTELLGF
jgi:hypothetical protein